MLMLATALEAQAQPTCWHSYEIEAARVRDLQTMLMMSALKCGSAGGTLESQYNAFVNKKRPLLTGHNNVLKARFMRESGIDGGQSAYDRFTTGLANSHSARAQSVNFCDMAGTLMTLAAGSTDEELSTLARSFSETPLGVGESCPVNMAAPAMPATPAVPAAPAAAPVKQEVAAAPTPQSAADALAAAAVAMQAAASAMKAEQAARPSSPVVAAGAEDAPLEVVQDAPVVPPTEL
ncbi:hypothetical protein BSL82_01440 [Tardibacter chloracetimidivorans]|uniref:Uncharacterized protein n=2 Tax=Tardibacter chloracetimidivorans TaxID=1921510 RepID=A0A1L3ZR69_9SPHN|nr:hypothetical protein BSL82_01440 [Tardibacter chloracetimidivorans]